MLQPMVERYFRLKENNTNIRTEVIAGITTFAAMAYILAANPYILSTTGMDPAALVTVTAMVSAITTAAMGLFANYPIALAPGMGLNAFFAFYVCGTLQIPWQSALGIVFCEGVLFLILSLSGIRQKIITAIPHTLKLAVTCGIGFFILFLGLKNGGIIVSHPATFVTLGDLTAPPVALVVFGTLLGIILVVWKIRGAVILAVLITAAIGIFITGPEGKPITAIPPQIVSLPLSIESTFLALDFSYLFNNFEKAVAVLLALLFVDLFDTMGTLIGVCHRAGLLDANGNLPRIGRALGADAGATMVGALLGTSTTTSYIESAAGVQEGGRTGLTSCVTALCFIGALFLGPLILAIPAAATVPALVIVGVSMMQSMRDLDLHDYHLAVPSILIIVLMPLTFSISEGIAAGFVTYVILMVASGHAKKISWVAYVLAALFLLHFIYGRQG